ncbi:hypothetical protein [Yersinia enterocolitica]|uniref:hypothetical protein n=1 Tax=Yersinia enterocolitica TaxID=630 RepID=UPI00083E620C|nr:hypothetical protein [Yersinia enterocolitica]AOF29503.1 hypothetical protein BED32_22200 [Yersinia enterocolitica]
MKDDGMKNAMSIFSHMDRIEASIAKGEPLKGRRQLWYVENISTLGAGNASPTATGAFLWGKVDYGSRQK